MPKWRVELETRRNKLISVRLERKDAFLWWVEERFIASSKEDAMKQVKDYLDAKHNAEIVHRETVNLNV